MATVAYPTGLPDPLVAGLTRVGVSPTRQVGPIKGPPVVFKWTDDQSDLWTVTWRYSPAQKRAFDAWRFNSLDNASQWFDIDLPISADLKGQLRTVEANFAGESPQTSYRGGFVFVTVLLTVRSVFRDTKEFTNSYLALIANGSDPVETIDLLEKLVNVDLEGIG